ENVEGAPARGVEGHRQHHRRSFAGDAADLANDLSVVLYVLDDVEGAHQIEGAVGKRQRGGIADGRQTAASLQACESRPADVEEMRAGERKARMQAGADLETRRCRPRDIREERPGGEALRRHQPARRPERVVEGSVGGESQATTWCLRWPAYAGTRAPWRSRPACGATRHAGSASVRSDGCASSAQINDGGAFGGCQFRFSV